MKTKTNTGNSYTFGEVVRLGAGSGSERFKKDGWSDTEKEFTWTTGYSAKLAFLIPPASGPLNLRMRLTGLLKPPQRTRQVVTVLANGQKIAEWQVANTADFIAVIPAGLVKDGGLLTLELQTPNPASPKSLGIGDDSRVLGVLCSEMAIRAGP
jgi:hypothetical protein